MISVTRLYCGEEGPGDAIRYGEKAVGATRRSHAASIREDEPPRSAAERRPVVVWNVTRSCNLKCIHCYTDSESRRYEGELTGGEARVMLDDLAAFRIPALLDRQA